MKKTIPVACTLGASEAANQLDEWRALHARIDRTERIEGGIRLRLAADLHATVDDLARRERACCRFLTIVVSATDSATVVEITSEQPAAGPVIDLLAGTKPD